MNTAPGVSRKLLADSLISSPSTLPRWVGCDEMMRRRLPLEPPRWYEVLLWCVIWLVGMTVLFIVGYWMWWGHLPPWVWIYRPQLHT